MISLTSTPVSSSSLRLLRTPGGGFSASTSISAFKPTNKRLSKRRIKTGECRAQLIDDAPLAAAIGACMLSSLILPNAPADADEEEGDAAMSTFDVKFAVMGILTFIPYFNWLSWIFAWMDTGKNRYAVYALVYLAPYIRSNMSLSTDESWLPLASIIFCIIHVQLEASIRNGDIQPFQFFGGASERSLNRKKGHQEELFKEERHNNLPSSETTKLLEEIEWDLPQKLMRDRESLNEDRDDDHRRNH